MDFVNENHMPLPLKSIEQALTTIVKTADNQSTNNNIGILTSQDRDSWADARNEIIAIGGITVQKALETLESGALLLCLDNSKPFSRTECAKHFLYGGGTDHESASAGSFSWANRWYDKSIQIFVCENGKTGMLGEHSMMDGMPVVGLANHICNTNYGALLKQQQHQLDANVVLPRVESIFQDCYPFWSSSAKLQAMLQQAQESHNKAVEQQSVEVQAFHAYGSSRIKQMGYSPDAFVQMAIQLATFRLWNGHQGATYEATQTRPFLHGRTETTRSVSPASAAFCHVMGQFSSNVIPAQEKLELLQKAVDSHVTYMKAAAAGHGVDRHLLGLSFLIKDSESTPDLYSDPTYIKAKTWRVSTSHLSHPQFDNWGFGQVVPHGVGIGYGILPQKIVFNITALKDHGWTSKLSHLLEEALLEMSALQEHAQGQENQQQLKSKL